MAGKITTNLTGQPKVSDLTITLNNSSGQQTLSIPHASASGGTNNCSSNPSAQGCFSDSFRTNPMFQPGQYGSVTATWDTMTASATLSFYNIGNTHFTQYNTPYQTSCSGAPVGVAIYNRMDSQNCYYSWTTTLPSDFAFAVSQNGTGVTSNGTVLKSWGAGAQNVCTQLPDGYDAGHTFFSVDTGGNPITKITGSNNTVESDASLSGSALNNSNPMPGSVATDYCATQGAPPSQKTCPSGMVSPSTYVYSDPILLFDQNDNNDSRQLRAVQDLCPACAYHGTQSGSTSAHIDMYNGTSNACSANAVGDYGSGYYNSIRVR